MTFQELLEAQKRTRKHLDDEEHRLQCACVRWFRLQYPQYATLLFAVPNGGRRDPVTGAKMKAEGVVAGVADLILMMPNEHHHALCIEMKTPNGRQSPSQKSWQHETEQQGYRYIICRTVEQFIDEITQYINGTK